MKRDKFNEFDIKKIISLYDEVSAVQIAKKFNCCHSTIYNILKKNNILIKGPTFFNKGNSSPMKGKKHTEEAKQKNREKHTTKEVLEKLSRLNTGKNNPFYGKHHKLKTINIIGKASDERWKNPEHRRNIREKNKKKFSDDEYKEKWLKNVRSKITKPNKPEKLMIDLIQKNNLPFNYVGNGKIWFRGYGTMFNPDFLSKNPKHIIEVFGDYWHNREDLKKRDKLRLATYARYGYKTLVIWEHELMKNKKPIETFKVLEKIKRLMG